MFKSLKSMKKKKERRKRKGREEFFSKREERTFGHFWKIIRVDWPFFKKLIGVFINFMDALIWWVSFSLSWVSISMPLFEWYFNLIKPHFTQNQFHLTLQFNSLGLFQSCQHSWSFFCNFVDQGGIWLHLSCQIILSQSLFYLISYLWAFWTINIKPYWCKAC